MKTIGEKETQRKQKQKRTRGGRSYGKIVRAKWFCCASFILALRQKELHESKHITVGCKYIPQS